MAGIEIAGLAKRYNSEVVVDNVNLKIKDNEFFVFVGPSGSGKSTILRLIAGLIKPTAGDIKFSEKTVTHLEARERNVALVFQNFGLRARKMPKEEIDKRVKKISSMLGIERLLRRWPKELSGGERQRVAIGRAIVRDPEVYLLDEPLSNLDARLRIDMRNELANIHRQVKTTFIYVTHDQIEAMTLGQRIAVINNGKLEQVDTPENLYDRPINRFVAGFIGSPPMNFLEGKFILRKETKQAGILLGETLLKLNSHGPEEFNLQNNTDVILGIRPESIIFDDVEESLCDVKINRIEPIGGEGLVYFKFAGHRIVARVNQWQKYKDSARLKMSIKAYDAYVFLPDDGKCIWSKGKPMT
jgi:multiple sugar transport system ATP-binding protein